MAEESPIRHPHLHRWKRIDSLVFVHLHLPAANRKHVEAEDVWRIEVYGTASHGRDADMGYLRQPSDGLAHIPHPFHHCSQNDERTITVKDGGAGCFHLQFSVRHRSNRIFSTSH
jgi:hypothetical protein